MLSQKSVLARLLANENISVQQGNFESAFFDVENRVLGLPLWKEMSADVMDLLVGHEVGHALYTPNTITPEELKAEGIPFAYMNVVEDIRIEKAVLAKYPGLVANFKRGYVDLMEMDIFGTKDVDINTMGFMDRLNIKAKGRDLVDIEFSEEEMPYFKKAMAVETFEEVKTVCQELVAWLGGKDDQNEEKGDGNKVEISLEENSEEGNATAEVDLNEDDLADLIAKAFEMSGESTNSDEDGEKSDQEGDQPGDQAEEAEEAEEGDNQLDRQPKEKPQESSVGPVDNGIPTPDLSDLPEVQTENAQKENMKDLLESDVNLFVQGMNRQAFDQLVNPYDKVLDAREKHQEYLIEQGGEEYIPTGYDEFMNSTKQVVNLMSKEFEMRKAAYRSARARNSNKGSLDVNKLHAYKYEDNLFKQVTTLADGKNHGMIMLVDYSGSMYNNLPSVIRQTIALVMFCKRVQIPFEVYAFTTTNSTEQCNRVRLASSNLTRFDYDDLTLNQLFSNKMSKTDFDRALKSFYAQTVQCRYLPTMERLGSTPLNAALLACEFIIKDFLKSNPVHKLNLVTLTDGASDYVRVVAGVDYNRDVPRPRGQKMIMTIQGKKVELDAYYGGGIENTAKIMNAVSGPNVTTSNFFICSRRDFKHEMYRLLPWDNTSQKAAQKEMTKDGVWVVNDKDGYNKRFIMVDKSNTMSGETEEFEVEESATPAQIARAFKKFSGSKKGNRVVAQKFTELVA